MKYGIGQKVRVKDFSELAKKYGVQSNGDIYIGDYAFEREMKVYCGEEYYIANHYDGNLYELTLNDGGYWYFIDEVLEDMRDKQLNEKPIILGVDIANEDDLSNHTDKLKRTYTRRK